MKSQAVAQTFQVLNVSLKSSFPCAGLIELGNDLVAHSNVGPVRRWRLFVRREKCCEIYATESNDMGREFEIYKGPETWVLRVRVGRAPMNMILAHLSMVRRHANFVNFFVAVNIARHCRSVQYEADSSPPRDRPILITYGKGMREVKLKHIVSSIRRSTASSLWRSSSTVWANALSD